MDIDLIQKATTPLQQAIGCIIYWCIIFGGIRGNISYINIILGLFPLLYLQFRTYYITLHYYIHKLQLKKPLTIQR